MVISGGAVDGGEVLSDISGDTLREVHCGTLLFPFLMCLTTMLDTNEAIEMVTN